MSLLYMLYLAIPCGVAFSLWAVPRQDLGLDIRAALHCFAFLLCYLPYFLGRHWRKQKPKLATAAYLSANALRILGLFVVLLLFQLYDSRRTLYALEIYAISVAAFLVFQLVTLLLDRKAGPRA